MKDLARLITLLKYCSDNLDQDGLDTLYNVVTNKAAFDDPQNDMAEASEVALHVLHTLYDIDGSGNVIFARPKLNLEGLMSDLCIMLERINFYYDAQRGEPQ